MTTPQVHSESADRSNANWRQWTWRLRRLTLTTRPCLPLWMNTLLPYPWELHQIYYCIHWPHCLKHSPLLLAWDKTIPPRPWHRSNHLDRGVGLRWYQQEHRWLDLLSDWLDWLGVGGASWRMSFLKRANRFAKQKRPPIIGVEGGAGDRGVPRQ